MPLLARFILALILIVAAGIYMSAVMFILVRGVVIIVAMALIALVVSLLLRPFSTKKP